MHDNEIFSAPAGLERDGEGVCTQKMGTAQGNWRGLTVESKATRDAASATGCFDQLCRCTGQQRFVVVMQQYGDETGSAKNYQLLHRKHQRHC
jgi:hypothetical protein